MYAKCLPCENVRKTRTKVVIIGPEARLYRRSPRRRPRASASQFRRDSASWAARTKKNGQIVQICSSPTRSRGTRAARSGATGCRYVSYRRVTAGTSPIPASTTGAVGGPPHGRRLRSRATTNDDRRDDAHLSSPLGSPGPGPCLSCHVRCPLPAFVPPPVLFCLVPPSEPSSCDSS